ncbi:MAG: hypothetical protein IJ007_03245 [Oscillospiraceae bacterium]|nr:hypothetical protein [Oscillospiraceae bacterium]
MADKRYSIDDILNEYPKGGGSGEKADLNELLDSYSEKNPPKTFSTEKVTLHNTDIFERPVAPDLSDMKIELTGNIPVQKAGSAVAVQEKPHTIKQAPLTEKEEDSFAQKYSGLAEKMAKAKQKTAENDQAEAVQKNAVTGSFSEKVEQGGTYKGEKPASSPTGTRSFSEKMEQGVVYETDREEAPVKESLAERFRRLRGKDTPPAVQEETPAEIKKPVKENPFDKYESISQQTEDNEAEENNIVKPADPFSFTEKKQSLDDILEEYSAKDTRKKQREFTQHKSITEFFTKILPDDPENSGNKELLDGMMRMKKERISRTQHIAPIERKSISDIDLNLDDKIIPDTAQIPIDKEQAEMAKLTELKERRSKKIKDFVLVGDEEETPEEAAEENEENKKTIEDFEDFEDAPSIASDILQLKNSLVIRMLMLLACFGAAAYIAIANDAGTLPMIEAINRKTSVDTYLFVNIIIGLLALFASWNVVSCGFSKLIAFKSDCDTLSAVAIITAVGGNGILYANPTLVQYGIAHVYTAAAVCTLLFNTLGKLLIVSRTQRSFRFVSGSCEKYALFSVEDEDTAQNFTRGTLRDFPKLASMRKTEFLEDFLKTSYASDSTDKFCCLFVPIILVASLIVALLAGITSDFGMAGIYVGVSAFTGCISMCSLVSMMLVVNLPMELASKKAAEVGGAVLGYNCIDEFADTNSVLIDAAQLFPQGSVNLAAIKVFSDTRIDEAIVEAASLTSQSGSILKNMFYDIIAGKTELLNPVESYIFEDSMGLCGWINNKRVLLGSRELMMNHSISGVPSAAKEQEYVKGRSAVYLSISGELSAMFIVEMKPSMEVKHALEALQKHEIYTIIRSVDSLVTIRRLSEMFDISPEFFKLIPFRLHTEFDDEITYQPKQHAVAACSGRFAALSYLITSCRKLRGTVSAGIAFEAIAILLGILICLAMVILNSFSEISATMAITYNIIFTVILVIFQVIRKN